MKGGSMGTRVHPDSPLEQRQRQLAAQQAQNAPTTEIDEGPKDWAVVAKGRSIDCPVPGSKQFIRYDKDGNAVYGPTYRRFTENQKVQLPIAEIERLQVLGFLVAHDKKFRTQRDAVQSQARDPRSRVIHSPSPGTSVTAAE
jgi:hypothetical protein